MHNGGSAVRLFPIPLKSWERDAVHSALNKAGLPADDVLAPEHLFWRFETDDEMPVGFGGLELHGPDALLRSIVTLPPMRRRGVGTAIVGQIEAEATIAKCAAIWLRTRDAVSFFERLGYGRCDRGEVPAAIRGTAEFATLGPEDAALMVKRL
jgi:N-acetylglutamate synthase-like GNAT family acetyltransferase